jgi:hypothetical protein
LRSFLDDGRDVGHVAAAHRYRINPDQALAAPADPASA